MLSVVVLSVSVSDVRLSMLSVVRASVARENVFAPSSHCDNGIVSISYDKNTEACAMSKVKTFSCASCECRCIDAQCFKVMRTPVLLYQRKLENV